MIEDLPAILSGMDLTIYNRLSEKAKTVLSILVMSGLVPAHVRLSECYADPYPTHFVERLEKAAQGDISYFEVKCVNRGRCLNEYTSVIINFTPDDDKAYCQSNWGNVDPHTIKTHKGIQYSISTYCVDSSD